MPKTIVIPPINDGWDPIKQEFINLKGQTIQVEHSLVSVSKWESKWKKSFLNVGPETTEELIDYIKCMTITQNVRDEVFEYIPSETVKEIQEYINDPMTATTFRDESNKKRNSEVVTSELMYYWMISLGIWPECQKWHLNKLLTLIRVCSIKNEPPKKMSKGEIMRRNKSLNASRRKALNTKG